MQFRDYSPAATPSPDDQRDALRKGLGRAAQWAAAGRLDADLLLEACLHDQRFDTQCEGMRGDWLWRLVRAVRATDRFRVPILHALYELADERDVAQLCQFAYHYAATGDEAFRTRLYEIVERKPVANNPDLGEEELVALDGLAGFLFAARVRGKRLATVDWEWDDGGPFFHAAERFGEEQVIALLEASTDEAVVRYRQCWLGDRQEREARKQGPTPGDRMAAIPIDEILRIADGDARPYQFRYWGRSAAEADLQVILDRLWHAHEPRVIRNLLTVFRARPLPAFDARLLDLCRHDADEVRDQALKALKENAHPRVRDFALTELSAKPPDGNVVDLFLNNYREGDEQKILYAIALPADENDLHWLLMASVKVLEKNREADCSRMAVVVYALTPCSNCRFYAARLLVSQQAAPAWLRDECGCDCEEDCRTLPGVIENALFAEG